MFAFYEKMNSCRKKCRPGGRSDFAVGFQCRFGLEAPDGFFGGGTEVAVRGLMAEELAAAAVIAAVDQEKLGGLHGGAGGIALEERKSGRIVIRRKRHRDYLILMPLGSVPNSV